MKTLNDHDGDPFTDRTIHDVKITNYISMRDYTFKQSSLFDFTLRCSKSGGRGHKVIAGGFIDLEVSYQLAVMSSQHFTHCLGAP